MFVELYLMRRLVGCNFELKSCYRLPKSTSKTKGQGKVLRRCKKSSGLRNVSVRNKELSGIMKPGGC